MAFLNGQEVRHRAAELATSAPSPTAEIDGARDAGPHLHWLSARTAIPVGTLHNATRDHRPQGISLTRVYAIADALRRPHETDVRDVVAAIVVDSDDDSPQKDDEDDKPERDRDPSGPPNRTNGDRDRKGPPRSDLKAAS